MNKILNHRPLINIAKTTLLGQKNIITSTKIKGVYCNRQVNKISNLPKESHTTTANILVKILKLHVLILVALVYIYLLNTIIFPHLSQIYLNYFQRLGQLARAENVLFTQKIIAISTVVYSLEVFYFVLIYHSKKYIFSRFLFLFALWSALALSFKYPLSLLRVFVLDVVNLIKIDQIEDQELTTDIATGIIYAFISFYIFKVLIKNVYFFLKCESSMDGSIKGNKLRYQNVEYDTTNS